MLGEVGEGVGCNVLGEVGEGVGRSVLGEVGEGVCWARWVRV